MDALTNVQFIGLYFEKNLPVLMWRHKCFVATYRHMHSLARAFPDDLCNKGLNLTSWPNEFLRFFCHLPTFFIINFFLLLPGRQSECQTVWIAIRTDIEIGLGPNYLQWLSADDKSRR